MNVWNRNLATNALFGAGLLAVVCASVVRTSVQGRPLQAVPEGAIPLFSGTPESLTKNWASKGKGEDASWKLRDGALVARGGDIMTKERFTDYQLHIEFRTPDMPNAKGQAKGNSGIFMQSRYEVQVLDSFGLKVPGKGDCGAIYNQSAPLLNATKPPLQWQTYDISFRAPRFDGDKVTDPARVTVILNGTVIQNNTAVSAPTWGGGIGKTNEPGPIVLQDHGNDVEFRNIWIRPLPLEGSKKYDPE